MTSRTPQASLTRRLTSNPGVKYPSPFLSVQPACLPSSTRTVIGKRVYLSESRVLSYQTTPCALQLVNAMIIEIGQESQFGRRQKAIFISVDSTSCWWPPKPSSDG